MTQGSPDPTPLWLKQMSIKEKAVESVWARHLIPKHRTIERSYSPPHGARALCTCGAKGFLKMALWDEGLLNPIWTRPEDGAVECHKCSKQEKTK